MVAYASESEATELETTESEEPNIHGNKFIYAWKHVKRETKMLSKLNDTVEFTQHKSLFSLSCLT